MSKLYKIPPSINRGTYALARSIVFALCVLVYAAASHAEKPFLELTGDSSSMVKLFGTSADYGDFQNGEGPALVVGAPGTENYDGALYALYGPYSNGLPQSTVLLRDLLWEPEDPLGKLGQAVSYCPNFWKDDGQFIPVFVAGAPNYPDFQHRGSVFQFFYRDQYTVVGRDLVSGPQSQETKAGWDVEKCDFNGDGYDDVAVGSNQHTALGNGGVVWIYLGGEDVDDIVDVVIEPGFDTTQFGMAVADVGDITEDGKRELLIRHEFNHKAYLVFGRDAPQAASSSPMTITIEQDDDGSNYGGITIPASYCAAVAGGFDIAGGSGLDIVVTERDEATTHHWVKVYDCSGVAGGGPLDLVCEIKGGNWFGNSLAMGGDVNGDQLPDLLVGCPGESPRNNVERAGMVAAFIGGKLPAHLETNAIYMTEPNIWYVSPIELNTGAQFGTSVGFMGDQDGDGCDDIFAGAPNFDTDTGRIYGFSLVQSDKITVTNLTPTILADVSENSTTFSVAASHVANASWLLNVTMTMDSAQLPDPIELTPDGNGNYSHTEAGLTLLPGEYDVEYFAVSQDWDTDGDGAFTLVKSKILVVNNNVVYAAPLNPDLDTGLSYQGTPYSSVIWDFDEDDFKDLFVSVSNDESHLYRGNLISQAGVPHFLRLPIAQFSGDPPQAGLRGISVGDLDNSDGMTDLFAAHETDSRLYRWDGSNMINLAATVGIDSYDDAISGSWGDLNSDGHLDLFISRADTYTEDPPNYGISKSALGSLVLTNVDDGSGGRTFSSTPGSGLPNFLFSSNATWADYDEDGDSDLFVGALSSAGAGASKLFRNDGGTLSDQTLSLLGSEALVPVVGSAWEDLNGDGRLDLVLTRHGTQSLVYFQTVANGFDDGAEGIGPMAFGPSHGFSGMVVYDYNNDGYRDFLGLSNHASRAPQLFQNVCQPSAPGFAELPSLIGLDDIGYVHGAVATDFGGLNAALDGLADLYLGRPISSDAFYFRADPVEASPADAHYVVVRLIGVPGLLSQQGIGSRVEVQAGSHTQVQIVDGGSMRGSQTFSDLVFGLGDETGPVTATIKWPGWPVQLGTPLNLDQINIVSNPPVTVLDGSVTGTYTAKANGLVDWIFTWATDSPSDPAMDEIQFVNYLSIPQQCRPSLEFINDGVAGVTVTYTPNPEGGYTHVMTWADRVCTPKCVIPFAVTSGYVGSGGQPVADTNDNATSLRVSICLGL